MCGGVRGGCALSVDCRIYISGTSKRYPIIDTKNNNSRPFFLRVFEIDKHNRRELLYYYCCGDDHDGLDAGSGSKNVKTRKSSQFLSRLALLDFSLHKLLYRII